MHVCAVPSWSVFSTPAEEAARLARRDQLTERLVERLPDRCGVELIAFAPNSVRVQGHLTAAQAEAVVEVLARLAAAGEPVRP